VDKGEKTDVAETVEHIGNATLFTWLAEKHKAQYPEFLLFFVMRGGVWESDAGEILAAFAFDLDSAPARIRKTFGIENNGLCLLISWTSELIYRRAWSETPAES
jgi:hypothetical protein